MGGEEEELRLSAHTLLLPTRGQLEARMMVTAFELGLDNITDDAVSTMVHAVEVCSISTQGAANLHHFACENIGLISYFDTVYMTALNFLWFQLCSSQRKLTISSLLFFGSVTASFERCPDFCNHPEEGISGTRRSLPIRLWQRRYAPAVSKEQPRRLPQRDRVVRATVPLIHTSQ